MSIIWHESKKNKAENKHMQAFYTFPRGLGLDRGTAPFLTVK